MTYTENIDVNNDIQEALNSTTKNESPIAMIIAGQPGAGKGSIAEYLTSKLDRNVIIIDPDEMREHHPDHERLNKENDKTAANYTHEDASRWAETLRDVAIENKRNIIIDGTLKSPEKAEALCNMLKTNGYKVEVHALAVNELQSKLGIIERYEAAKAKDGYGRFVPETVHDGAYHGMVKSLGVIEAKKLADVVAVHTRDDKSIYENRLNDQGAYSQARPHAQEVVAEQREKAFSKDTQATIKETLTHTDALMDKRNAPQEDKNALSRLSSSINKKILKDDMRSLAQDTLQNFDHNLQKQSTAIEKPKEIDLGR